MDLKEYQEFCKKTAKKDFNTKEEEICTWGLGISGEAGDVASCIKKTFIHKNDQNLGIKENLGDTMWYIATICNCMNWDLNQVLDENVKKLSVRFPQGFTNSAAFRGGTMIDWNEKSQNKGVKFKIKKLKENAIIPCYANPGDAGMDLFSTEKYTLMPGQRCLVSTGISVEFPVGYELQVRPRSGLALKKGISLVNTPGTVDAGYRGEIGIIVINLGQEVVEINPGDKIAQAVLNKFEVADIEESKELSETQRGAGGFGSSGFSVKV